MPIESRHAFAAYAKRGSRLRALRNLQLVFPLERRNRNFGAKSGLRERDGNHAMQIVALALKESMLFDVQHNVQIARGSAERSRFTKAGETDARAIFDAGGHFGFDHPLAQQAP